MINTDTDMEMVRRVLADGCHVYVVTCEWSTTRVFIAPDENTAREEALEMFDDSLLGIDDPVAKVTMVTSQRVGRRVLCESKGFEYKHWLDEGEDVSVHGIVDGYETTEGDITFEGVLELLPKETKR